MRQMGVPHTESGLRTVLRSIVRNADLPLFRTATDVYFWSTDGQPPPRRRTERVERMITLRLEGRTLEEIAVVFGVTRERVRQLVVKHDGPTADELRAERRANDAAEKAHLKAVVGQEIREAADAGPMTAEEMARLIERDVADVVRYWPSNIRYLRVRDSAPFEQTWTDDSILAAIRDAAIYEFPLTANAYSELVRVGQVQGPSLPRIGQRFGTWAAACDRAGVEHGATMRAFESRWTDGDLLEYARQYFHAVGFSGSAHRYDEWKRIHSSEAPSLGTLRNRFGTWTEIKRRALGSEQQ